MCGSATFTTVTSRTSMNWISASTASAFQRRGSAPVAPVVSSEIVSMGSTLSKPRAAVFFKNAEFAEGAQGEPV